MYPSPLNHHSSHHTPPFHLQQRRRPRPSLEPFSIQMNPEQSSASGSLYVYNPAMVPRSTNYDRMGMGNEDVGVDGAARVQPFSFACELAHGSNQVRISGFANIPELYQRIAETFSIPVSQIMYCTLDTPRVDMNKLLGNQLSFNHVIYAHIRGQTKEVSLLKSADALGLTVSDNKAGGVFVKRTSNNGVVAKFLEQYPDGICPGDLIECINGRSFINSRHMDVVKYLKGLPLDSRIVLRLISPEKSPLSELSKRHKHPGTSGKQTIRFATTGADIREALSAICQTSDGRPALSQSQEVLLRRLAETVEDFIGIADEELAQSIYDLECRSATKEDFFKLLKEYHSDFNFPPRIAEKFWLAYEYHLDPMRSHRN
ncbi:PDZ domain containing protein GIPC3 [Echinococcus multilocularis]|uniref:PDZ domain containing protein GIPC3 n=1 Tax=Echinococcus multilocularis TaxID=6211 RepID=A0A087W0Q9_ECHMU|nr:PDZ domain containing protein GIPC3 [Echinococcus multilocularis]